MKRHFGQRTSFIKNGANDFLVKPFLSEEFYCRINQNVDYVDIVEAHKKANELKNLALGTAAHDIRGPISVIKGLAELMKRPANENNKIKREKYMGLQVNLWVKNSQMV